MEFWRLRSVLISVSSVPMNQTDARRCSYGYMKNMNAKLFHHPNPKAWMCELNRLWIDDCLGKNAETVLIAASIKANP